MSSDDLELLRARRREGDVEAYVEGVLALARQRPGDVAVRVEAAYACDRYRSEEEAARHYDAAWALGVPEGELSSFSIGYGSTLRNVGRHEEAVAVLQDAVARAPTQAAPRAFLALALHATHRSAEAAATLLDVILDLAAGTDRLDGYERALAYYRDELRSSD